MTSSEIKVMYDDELGVSLPSALLEELEITPRNITYLSRLPDHLLKLNEGIGPVFAAILVRIQDGIWDYVVEKVLDGLTGLIRRKWFESASDKATKAEKMLIQKHPTNDYARVRQRMLSSSRFPIEDNFPYSLMNISISESGRRWVQVLFPYPMTDIQAQSAVAQLREILPRIEPSSAGIMIFDKNAGKWEIKGAIKLSENDC